MSPSIVGRALHFVVRVGDRAKVMHFYRNILGMKILRHEEFKEGCEAQCNGPYDNRWSKTMIGYGPESSHFVIELTYNYGVKKYEMGNDFAGITIKCNQALERAKDLKWPITVENNLKVLTSPDGHKFYVIDEPKPEKGDPVCEVALNCKNIETTKKYWHELLEMQLSSSEAKSILLSYGKNQASLRFNELGVAINHATAGGRIAFAVPGAKLAEIQALVEKEKGTILKPLVELETPGKATVSVVILADPDGHEICFVNEEGFSELSQVDENAEQMLEKYLEKDPYQDKESLKEIEALVPKKA